MSTYYLDLAQTGSGHAGTELDPWSWADASAGSYSSGDIVLIRGSATVANANFPLGYGNIVTLDKWGDDPWRIRVTDDFRFYSQYIVKNGIISIAYDSSITLSGPLNNMNIIHESLIDANINVYDASYGLTTVFKGCSIKAGKLTAVSTAIASAIDSIIAAADTTRAGDTDVFIITNCATTSTDPGAWLTKTNCQFGWTAPTWPAWDASKASWASDILNVGITTPPEPGNPPYTDYATDPWGATRTGIGALSFPSGIAPAITTQPISLTKVVGQSADFLVDASGTTPFTYQWKKDASSIADATFATYSIASVLASSAGSYLARVTNIAGYADSSAATLTVQVPPEISVQPSSISRADGQSASFSVTATGDAPLTYQWKKDSTDISGATSSTYSIAAVVPTNAGSYLVHLANAYGVADSSSAILTVVTEPPVITNQPSDVTASSGSSATFGVTATGALYYQWYRNNLSISGATDTTYVIPSVYKSLAGSYRVGVSDDFSGTDSSSVNLVVSDSSLPYGWVPQTGSDYVSPHGRRGTHRMVWITDGTHGTPLGVSQIIDF